MTLLMSKMQIFKFHKICNANAIIIIIMTQNIIRTNKEAPAILLLPKSFDILPCLQTHHLKVVCSFPKMET